MIRALPSIAYHAECEVCKQTSLSEPDICDLITTCYEDGWDVTLPRGIRVDEAEQIECEEDRRSTKTICPTCAQKETAK